LSLQFLLKIDSGYPKDAGITYFMLANPVPWDPLRYNTVTPPVPLGHLHQSPPLPIPQDRARGKRRGNIPGAAARHSQSARDHTDLSTKNLSFLDFSGASNANLPQIAEVARAAPAQLTKNVECAHKSD